MNESRRQFVAALTAGVTGALAGCGGSGTSTPSDDGTSTQSDDGTATPSDDTTPTQSDDGTATPSDDTTPTQSDDGTATPSGGGTERVAQTVTVGPEGDFRFDPSSFTVSAGDTVVWEWGSDSHNVKPDDSPDGSDWTGTPGGDTFNEGYTHQYTFETPGEYSYYCVPHRSFDMVGSFTVTEQ